MHWLCPLVLLLAACARPPESSDSAPPPDLQNAEITVVVNNQHWLDLNIYLVQGPSRRRLGIAPSQSSKVISVPWARITGSTIRLGGDPFGDRASLVTDFLAVRPNAVVEWTVGSGLRQSSASVY